MSNGVRTVISLSNRFYHENRDGKIRRAMEEAGFDCEAFFHIPNEDHLDSFHYRHGMGPTVAKIHKFLEIFKLRISFGKIAVYCGAGEGRTYVYLAAYILSHYKLRSKDQVALAVEEVVEKVLSSSIRSMQRSIRIQMDENGGIKTLHRFAATLIT